MYSSVVVETSGYEAMIDGEKGDRSRMGRARSDAAYRAEAEFSRENEG